MAEYTREKQNCDVKPNAFESIEDVKKKIELLLSKLSLKLELPGIDAGNKQFTLPEFKLNIGNLQENLKDEICSLRNKGADVSPNIPNVLDNLFDILGNLTNASLATILDYIWNQILSDIFPGRPLDDFITTINDRISSRGGTGGLGNGLDTFNSPAGLEYAIRSRDRTNGGSPNDDILDALARIRDLLNDAASRLLNNGTPLVETTTAGGLNDILNRPAIDTEEIAEGIILSGRQLTDQELLDIIMEAIDRQNIRSIQDRNDMNFCPELRFDIRHYVRNDANGNGPILTTRRVASLKKVFNTILKPIVDYYTRSGLITEPGCALVIVLGLASRRQILEVGGNSISRHLEGEAVDFIIRSVMPTTIFNDIIDNKININYGVMNMHPGYTHITLPYFYNGQRIERVNISHNAAGTLADINHKW